MAVYNTLKDGHISNDVFFPFSVAGCLCCIEYSGCNPIPQLAQHKSWQKSCTDLTQKEWAFLHHSWEGMHWSLHSTIGTGQWVICAGFIWLGLHPHLVTVSGLANAWQIRPSEFCEFLVFCSYWSKIMETSNRTMLSL